MTSLPDMGAIICTWGNCGKFAIVRAQAGMSMMGPERYTLCKRSGCHLKKQVYEFNVIGHSALAIDMREMEHMRAMDEVQHANMQA